MRLIDADALINTLNKEKIEFNADINYFILNAPTIEAEPARVFGEVEKWLVHGHWIGKPIGGYSTVRCSVCGDVFSENNGKWNYCPNCGAKMDEVNDE